MASKDCYNIINPLTEEVSELSKRKVDTSEEYLKWKFSKEVGKKGLYFEYKPVSTENSLVIILVYICEFMLCNFSDYYDKFLY